MAPRPTVSAPVHAMQRRSVGSVSHRKASACAHPSMLCASQERDWIAVPVRRNADGEEGEAVEHTKGETRDLCLGEPPHTGAERAATLLTPSRAVVAAL